MKDVRILKDWIHHENGGDGYGLSSYGFASKIENEKEFCEKVTRDFMKAKHIDDSEFEETCEMVWDWASDFTELCGAGLGRDWGFITENHKQLALSTTGQKTQEQLVDEGWPAD